MNSTESPAPVRQFAMRFSSTPRGARLARRLCGERLDAWGIPYGSDAHDVLTLVAAELCANAVRHGHVAGRDFHAADAAEQPPESPEHHHDRTRGSDRHPRGTPPPPVPGPMDEPDDEPRAGGRGLLVVEALADRWGCAPRVSGPGKTVWAEYVVRGGNQ